MANINVVRGQLTNFEVFYEGKRTLGMATIDLPEISYRTVNLTGAGIAGQMSMPTQGMVENLEVTIHWRSIHADLTLLAAQRAHDLTLRGSQHIYDAATGKMKAQAVKIDLRGIPTKMTFGKFEQASETDSQSTLTLDYLKITVDGEIITEFDRFNYILKINGTDYLGDTRNALGL